VGAASRGRRIERGTPGTRCAAEAGGPCCEGLFEVSISPNAAIFRQKREAAAKEAAEPNDLHHAEIALVHANVVKVTATSRQEFRRRLCWRRSLRFSSETSVIQLY
jgi:hypothetical protein